MCMTVRIPAYEFFLVDWRNVTSNCHLFSPGSLRNFADFEWVPAGHSERPIPDLFYKGWTSELTFSWDESIIHLADWQHHMPCTCRPSHRHIESWSCVRQEAFIADTPPVPIYFILLWVIPYQMDKNPEKWLHPPPQNCFIFFCSIPWYISLGKPKLWGPKPNPHGFTGPQRGKGHIFKFPSVIFFSFYNFISQEPLKISAWNFQD